MIPNFMKLMEEWVRKERKTDREPLVFYPSQLGTECLRKLFYTQLLMKDIEREKLMIFEAGSTIHSWVTDFLKWCSENKDDIELWGIERPFSLVFSHKGVEIDIHGRIDNILKINEEPYIWETKSVKSFFRRKKKGGFEEYPLPLKRHIIQIHPYMRSRRYKKAILFYVEKTTFKVKWFVIDYDTKVMDEIKDKIRKVVAYIVDGKLPPRIDEDMKSWVCNYCRFNSECNKNYIPEIESQR